MRNLNEVEVQFTAVAPQPPPCRCRRSAAWRVPRTVRLVSNCVNWHLRAELPVRTVPTRTSGSGSSLYKCCTSRSSAVWSDGKNSSGIFIPIFCSDGVSRANNLLVFPGIALPEALHISAVGRRSTPVRFFRPCEPADVDRTVVDSSPLSYCLPLSGISVTANSSLAKTQVSDLLPAIAEDRNELHCHIDEAVFAFGTGGRRARSQ